MLVGQYLRHSDLYGNRVHFQTLVKKLRKLNRSSVITNLSVINSMFAHIHFFGRYEEDFPNLQQELHDNYLKDSVRAEIHHRNKEDYIVFTRLQTLYLLQLSIRYCADKSTILVDGKTKGGFDLGDCFLMASDYLISPKEEENVEIGSNKKRVKHLGFQLAPSIELQNPLDFKRGIVRSEIIYSQILESKEFEQILIEKKRSDFDIPTKFKQSTKISLQQYFDITLAILFNFLEKTPLAKAQWITPKGFLRFSILDKKVLKNYLKLESKSLEGFDAIFRREKRYLKQFRHVSFKPFSLIEIFDEMYVCADLFFLSEKLNSGVYWKIFDTLPKSKKEDFFSVYGIIFELYVRHLLKKIVSKNNNSIKGGLLLSSPKYQIGNELFDEIIYFPETKHLIVIETKSSFMHTEAKYGKSIRKFETEIRKKFIAKENGTGKGIGQLANHIGSMFHENRDLRFHIDNSDFDSWIQGVEKISPILITQEPIISFHIIEDFLNTELKKKLEQEKVRASVKISQLTVINVETLEKLKPYLETNQLTLEQCVNLRAYKDPKYKQHFEDFVFDKFKLSNVEDKESNEIFERVLERIKQRFFDETNT